MNDGRIIMISSGKLKTVEIKIRPCKKLEFYSKIHNYDPVKLNLGYTTFGYINSTRIYDKMTNILDILQRDSFLTRINFYSSVFIFEKIAIFGLKFTHHFLLCPSTGPTWPSFGRTPTFWRFFSLELNLPNFFYEVFIEYQNVKPQNYLAPNLIQLGDRDPPTNSVIYTQEALG